MSSDPKSGFDGLGIEDIIKIINADGSVFSSGDLGRMF